MRSRSGMKVITRAARTRACGGSGMDDSRRITGMAGEEDVRSVVLALPGVFEAPTWGGDPGFKVGKKLLAHLYDDGRLVVRIDHDERAVLLAERGEEFSCSTPRMPFIEVRLAMIAQDELAELLEDAWRLVAPRRVVRDWDQRNSKT